MIIDKLNEFLRAGTFHEKREFQVVSQSAGCEVRRPHKCTHPVRDHRFRVHAEDSAKIRFHPDVHRRSCDIARPERCEMTYSRHVAVADHRDRYPAPRRLMKC